MPVAQCYYLIVAGGTFPFLYIPVHTRARVHTHTHTHSHTLTLSPRSQAEISEFEQFAKQERVHDALFSRIAPNIFGSEDIKKAVACLLFGGSRKVCTCRLVFRCCVYARARMCCALMCFECEQPFPCRPPRCQPHPPNAPTLRANRRSRPCNRRFPTAPTAVATSTCCS